MSSSVAPILSWSRRHRLAVGAATVALVLASLFGLRRLAFDTDVLSLLPHEGRVIPAFRTFLASFGSLDDLYIVFSAPPGHAVADYDAEVDAWLEALRHTPEIVRVDSGTVDTSHDFGWLADRQLLLLRDDSLPGVMSRFDGEGMREAVSARRALLAVPSPAVTQMVRQDPLGLFDVMRAQLGGTQAGLNLGVTEGGYVTKDGRKRLVIAKPARPPYDAQFSRALFARLEAIRAQVAANPVDVEPGDDRPPPLQVEFAGGHRIALETESVVRRESISNTVGSLALILPLLFLVFRSLWLVGIGSLPSAISLLMVLGGLGFANSTLSAAATASAAMLFGLGIDGVVLLYVAYTHALNEGAEPDAAIDSLTGSSYSMLLGMWTTAATFYGLVFVDFPSLEQLGRLIGHSMVLCGLLTLVLVPATLPRRRRARRARSLTLPFLAVWVTRHRVAILAGAAIVTLLLGAAATRLRINPTLDRLKSVTPAAMLEEAIAPMFGLPTQVYVVLDEGPDLQALLASNERLVAELARTQPDLPLQPATALLPSEATQSRRAQIVSRSRVTAAAADAALIKASEAAGFRADSFDPFRERLPRLLDSRQRLTFEDYRAHGLGGLVERFVAPNPSGGWRIASYAFPASRSQVTALETAVAGVGSHATLTGLPLVNEELSRTFLPQFIRGLAIGTLIVIVIVVWAFRHWWLSVLALLPTAIGLVWAAGLLSLAGAELDLFALFAVVTFVGIGVDYGIHLVQRYREQGDAAGAIEELAPVILVAAGITVLGYGTLVTSSYPPLRSIGVVSAVSVAALAVASVLVLPALLITSTPPKSKSPSAPPDSDAERDPAATVPRRWTLHGLNNGAIFGATRIGVGFLPRRVSYALGHVATWIAWRAMASTRAALADNLKAIFPDETSSQLERRGLTTLRSYALDIIDFLRALKTPGPVDQLFEFSESARALFERLRDEGKGVILVTGHFGNWEVGGVLFGRLQQPFTIVAMAEADPTVNRLRREIREEIGADTIEVRQSIDTPLQIRRRLADNRIVAMLVDRHYGRDRVAVTLFGRRAFFLRTPFVMGLITGAAVLPCSVERLAPGRFALRPGTPIYVSRDHPRDHAIAAAAQQVAETLEKRIRARPELWYHFYRYWSAQRDDYDGLA